MTTDRTSLSLTDERKRLLEQAEQIVAADDHDDPPRSDVIDAALTHLIESEENIQQAREDGIEPTTIQQFNTSVLGLRYRTRVESRWR
jgi:metal-responsive CopG/Arc/MetJ family transcriptional regulator